MVVRATGINPAMLRWARERAGYSVEEVASRMKRAPNEITAWESGEAFLTWRQLERLARDLYHRPTASFFLWEPPEEETPSAEFRRIPEKDLEDLEPDTWLAVREAKARQLELAELAEFNDSDERSILRDMSNATVADPDELATEVRRYLGIGLDDQLGWASDDDALSYWRDAVQTAGVWVFKRSFRQHDVAGFCLNGGRYPLVYLNNGQPKVRQIFTLFYELAHLLYGFNHLERSEVDRYLSSLQGADREVEIACNRFAGEFLVPKDHFLRTHGLAAGAEPTDDVLARLSENYRVSREIILRKYLDQGWINSHFYHNKVNDWRSEVFIDDGKRKGGDYYANQGTYLGVKYAALAFRGYYQGAYGIDQLAEYLNIKASNISRLENWLTRRLAPR